MADLLLKWNSDLEHESEGGRTPLMKAVRAGHYCTAKFLLGKGANSNKATTNNDHTPLSLACAGGHLAIVELLLQNKADPYHKLKDNSTMLIEVSLEKTGRQCGNFRIFQLFRFYMKSILEDLEVLKMPIFAMFGALNFVNFGTFQSLKKCKNT